MRALETIDIENNPCKFQYKMDYSSELNPVKVYFKVFSIPQNPVRWFS